jgi:hypothetical protein
VAALLPIIISRALSSTAVQIISEISGADQAERLLEALAEQLEARGSSYHLIVVGGSALLALGLVDRPTKDVDVVAVSDGESLMRPSPLPADLVAARDTVARDFGLPTSWLNDGPASLLDFGLPDGFMARADRRLYGAGLTVSFASRFDQIHFKLYATVDQGTGKHERDLRQLDPSRDELIEAARWTRTHDPSEGYLQSLVAALRYLGVEDADLGP